MTDYSQIIDAETWAFIERSKAFYPPVKGDYTVAQRREIYDMASRHFCVAYPANVTAENSGILATAPARTIPIRIYQYSACNATAVILYFHGGGFMLGSLDSHDDLCAELCGRTGLGVVSVDYRLAPEHLYPAYQDDGFAAFEWLAATYDLPIVLSGDSAGGSIAAAIAGHYREHPRASIGQVLIYPELGGDPIEGSYVTHSEAPMLTTRDVKLYRNARSGGTDLANEASFAPLRDTAFAALPPTVVVTAECDPLSSDGQVYSDRINAAGGKALWIEESGLVHGYLRARHTVGRASDSFERIVEALTALGTRSFPSTPTTDVLSS